MIEVVFVTGNKDKFAQVVVEALSGYSIKLVREELLVTKIQDTDFVKIAEFSASWVSNKLNKEVVVTDAAYYIKALNGVPGPFVKFVNSWLLPSDILKMMKNKEDRKVDSPVCVSYCKSGSKPVSFVSQNRGTISYKPEGEDSTMDQIFISEGYNHTVGTLSKSEGLSLWNTDN